MNAERLSEIAARMRARAVQSGPWLNQVAEVLAWADEIDDAALAAPSLTAEQREAIEAGIAGLNTWCPPSYGRHLEVLRSMLGGDEEKDR